MAFMTTDNLPKLQASLWNGEQDFGFDFVL
jgi:hypothetical protein